MATPLTRYAADDGREFKTEGEADRHTQATKILRDLRPSNPTDPTLYNFIIVALERGWKFSKD